MLRDCVCGRDVNLRTLQFTRPARSGQISCLHEDLTDQQDEVDARANLFAVSNDARNVRFCEVGVQ